MQELIFGKDNTSHIVSCEVNGETVELFIEKDGKVESKFIQHRYWILAPRALDKSWIKLEGNLYHKYIKFCDTLDEFLKTKRYYKDQDLFSIYDNKEAAMVRYGFTYFKGMKVEDVSVLGFDIEATGTQHNDKSKVLLISNTFIRNGTITKKLFAYDDYETEAQFFDAWCDWVHEQNPSVVVGHNIFGYDLPYLEFCAKRSGTSLALGRDGSDIRFNRFTSKFRKDGSQDYDYTRAYIYGRELVDTMFLAIHFDFARKYENYSLKGIIKQEGLEAKDRQFYDASQIGKNYLIPEEWVKIKAYAEDDADDAVALYKLMIPAYFYLNQSIPKSFQSINYSASGSQINSFLIRSYLQDGHSIPKATQGYPFEGAISQGFPGVYRNVFKLDIASLYPSIMIQYEVYDKFKDPLRNFSKMVNYFTDERLRNKKKGKETGDRYYKELEQAQKIVINSCYGMLGASGLAFNSPSNAEFVTRKGREILTQALEWVRNSGFTVVNCDTDSISVSYQNQHLTEEDRLSIKEQLNECFPDKIRWEDDGYFLTVLVLKAKNYVLYDGKKVKIKGSALKSSKLEPALKKFLGEVIDCFIKDQEHVIINIYNNYIRQIFVLNDIQPWCSKKTITDKVLNPERTNEQKILDAVEGMEVQMGDKLYFYFDKEKNLKRSDQWKDDHHREHLCDRVWKTLSIFKNVLDITKYPKYNLKKNQKELLPKLLAS